MTESLESVVGNIGCRQWIKNKIGEQFAEYAKNKSTDIDKFIAELNVILVTDFKKEVNTVLDELTKAVDKELS